MAIAHCAIRTSQSGVDAADSVVCEISLPWSRIDITVVTLV